MTRHQLTLFTRPGCGLCEELQAELEPWLSSENLDLELVDISEDPDLQARFGHRIPVLFVDGEELCFGKLDCDLLQESLAIRP